MQRNLGLFRRFGVKINLIHKGSKRTINCEEGDVLMEKIQQSLSEELQLFGFCEGDMDCSSCKVYIPPDQVKKLKGMDMTAKELFVLEGSVKHSEFLSKECKERLSCQITVSQDLEGLTVYIPEEAEEK